MEARPNDYHGANVATVNLLALYALVLGVSFRSVGLQMFQNLSPEGREFWALQGIFLAVLIIISFPHKRQRSWVSVARLVIAIVLLLSCVIAAGVSDGFRY